MMSPKEFVESGVLELYALGQANSKEMLEVEVMIGQYPEVGNELDLIFDKLEQAAMFKTVEPDPGIKFNLMATLHHLKRIDTLGELSSPPILTETSTAEDFALWLNKEEFAANEPYDNMYMQIIEDIPGKFTSIMWIKDSAPEEEHDDIRERLLILEGTCDVTVDGEIIQLKPGDYFDVPLYKKHSVVITSECACKFILQKLAA